MSEFVKLFEPIRIGSLELKNRLAMAPMGTWLLDEDGRPPDIALEFYLRRAEGGVGLVVMQTCTILPESRASGTIPLHDDKFVPLLSELAAGIKRRGARVAVPLVHHGILLAERRVGLKGGEEVEVVGPSAIPLAGSSVMPRVLTNEDIAHIADAWADSAVRAQTAGFDAVMIQGAHGYLISQFRSSLYNCRTDEYGGSVSNRARFACEVVAAIRRKVGAQFPIILRISGSDFSVGGATIEDTVAQAPLFVAAGADVIDIVGGSIESRSAVFPSYLLPNTPNLAAAAAVKRVVGVPVMVAGKMGNLALAEQALEDGKVDIVALGRPLIADPDLPLKAQTGKSSEIDYCLYCNNCTKNRGGHTKTVGYACTVNPGVLRGAEFAIRPATKSKRILVVGGGPAGMEAARTLANRGHAVSLFEKDNRLGGQWNTGTCVPDKEDFARFTDRLTVRLKEAGVQVYLDREVTAELVQGEQPDVVVLATGAVANRLNVPGIERRNVVLAEDVILGTAQLGQRIAVVGGGNMGLEVALLLTNRDKRVIVVEALPELGSGMEMHVFKLMLERLMEAGVQLVTSSPLYMVLENGIYVTQKGHPVFIAIDSVVLATGMKPRRDIEAPLRQLGIETYRIGDCDTPGDAMAACLSAAEVARAI